ncbi:MAG: hypothetical protein K0S08_2153 [Gammaproteobacteria bacterium]|nr:hypothetical protein [Gammaproteobacteria bacterium]
MVVTAEDFAPLQQQLPVDLYRELRKVIKEQPRVANAFTFFKSTDICRDILLQDHVILPPEIQR